MTKSITTLILALLTSLVLFAQQKDTTMQQSTRFEDLTNQLSFNIFNGHPDSTVYWFIKKYYPYLLNQEKITGWTSYPSGPIPDYQLTVHSLKFRNHPFVDFSFAQGRLDIETKEVQEGGSSLWEIYIWFIFDSEAQARIAFQKLRNRFEKVSSHHKLQIEKGRTIAEFKDDQKKHHYDQAYLVLTQDEIYPDRYKILLSFDEYNNDKVLYKY